MEKYFPKKIIRKIVLETYLLLTYNSCKNIRHHFLIPVINFFCSFFNVKDFT